MKHSYVQKCCLPITAPETLGGDISTRVVLNVGRAWKYLSTQRLEAGFNLNITNYLTEDVGSEISHLATPQGRVATTCTSHSMINGKWGPTDAV